MAGGMEAKHDFGLGWFFNPQALRADGDAPVVADLDECAHAPEIIPPRTARGRAQDGAFFFFGGVPGAERGLAQLARDFMGVMVGAPGVDGWVGFMDLRDFFTGKAGGQAALPERVFAFDFAFGLGRGGVAQADFVELERPAQLGQRVGIVCEKNAVIIDVELEGAAVGEKGGEQNVKAAGGESEFFGGCSGADPVWAEGIEHMPEEGRGLAVDELLMFFKTAEYQRDLAALARRQDGRRGEKKFLFC